MNIRETFSLIVVVFLLLLSTGCASKTSQVRTAQPSVTTDAMNPATEDRVTPGASPPEPIPMKNRQQANKSAVRPGYVPPDIHFAFDRAAITETARETLLKLGQWLSQRPEATVLIEGHCDERGTAEYNLALGARRAAAARNVLLDYGLNGSRLTTISFGEERPLDARPTEEAWALNRRAHFVLND